MSALWAGARARAMGRMSLVRTLPPAPLEAPPPPAILESGMTDLHLGMFLFFTLVLFCCVVAVMAAYGFTQLAREMRKRELTLAFKEGREEQRRRAEEERASKKPLFPTKLANIALNP